VVSATLTLLIVFATLTFGAVYPWSYLPLFGVATGLGLLGLAGMFRRRAFPPGLRLLSVGLLLFLAAVGAQLVPLSRATLQTLSPHTSDVLSQYSFAFAGGAYRHALSINAQATRVGFIGIGSLAIYAIGLSGLLSGHDLRTLPRNLILFAALLAVVGIYTREHNNGLVYGFWQPLEGTNANGFGPFVNRNHFAGWMLMATCLTLGVLCGRIERARGSAKRDLRSRLIWLSSAEVNRVTLIAAGAMTMAVSLVWTMSRSGIISLACAVGCFLWLVARRRGLGGWNRAVIVALLGMFLLVGLNWRGIDRIAAWFGDTRDLVDRTAAWRDGWQVVRDFPLAGTGINTYADAMIFYQKHVLEFWMTHAHNDYLQLLAEGGLLVFVPATSVVVLLAVAVYRRVREAKGDSYDYWVRVGASVGLIAIGIQETVEFSLQIPANALLFATLAAIAISPYSSRKLVE
jgi:O-antigen ligase